MSYREFVRNIPSKPAIVAHRGAWHDAPENSLPAIEGAIKQGCEIVEVDVQKSADGTYFILHDDSLARMTGVNALAQSLTMKDLKALPLRNRMGGDGEAFTDHRIPTLEEILDVSSKRILFDLDVKSPEHLPGVADVVASMGMRGQVDIKIDVQTREQADYLKKLEAEYGLMVMPKTDFNADTADTLIDLLKYIGANVVESTFDSFETISSRADAFRQAGLAVWVNTLDSVACCGLTDSAAISDPSAVWERICDGGVSIIQTDETESLMNWRAS